MAALLVSFLLLMILGCPIAFCLLQWNDLLYDKPHGAHYGCTETDGGREHIHTSCSSWIHSCRKPDEQR